MNLSEAFDCVPYNLRTVKLYANRFLEDEIAFISSFLKRNQYMKLTNTVFLRVL